MRFEIIGNPKVILLGNSSVCNTLPKKKIKIVRLMGRNCYDFS